jgi:hypothetical protein
MRKPTALLLMGALALSACSGDTKDKRTAPASSAAVAPSTGTAPPMAVTAKVVSDRECTDKRQWGCWLPLGATPTHDALLSPNPINMSVEPGSPCDDKTALQGCWPQPGDEVKVACQEVVGNERWVAVIVPFKSVVNKNHQAARYGEGFLGWNRARYVDPEKTPATCPN